MRMTWHKIEQTPPDRSTTRVMSGITRRKVIEMTVIVFASLQSFRVRCPAQSLPVLASPPLIAA